VGSKEGIPPAAGSDAVSEGEVGADVVGAAILRRCALPPRPVNGVVAVVEPTCFAATTTGAYLLFDDRLPRFVERRLPEAAPASG
jgi:hypothetical protein